jgi:glycosyltransferase involved in cell wall biosynthesis
MKILIIAPHKSKIGTTKVTIETANILSKYFTVYLLDSCFEWKYVNVSDKVNIINFPIPIKLFLSYLGKKNFLRGRLFMIFTAITLFLFLPFICKKNKIDIVYSSLITLPTLVLRKISNYKVFMSVQGLPKFLYSDTNDRLNYFEGVLRKYLWSLFPPDLYIFMTKDTYNLFNKLNKPSKSIYLPNPVITDNLKILAEEFFEFDFNRSKNIFLSIGRLTSQKNYSLLIDAISVSSIKNNSIFYIIGEGEQITLLQSKVKRYKLESVVFFLGYLDNPYFFLKNCDCFIQTSLWEDPGHALIEAAFFNKILISSNCPNGPSEILKNGFAGILFENNDLNSLISVLDNFEDYKSRKFDLPQISQYHTSQYEINIVKEFNQHFSN